MVHLSTRRNFFKGSLAANPAINIDPDLCFGTMSTALQTLSKYRQGSATAGHVAEAASAVKLLASHFAGSGLDEALAAATPKLSTSSQPLVADPTTLSSFIAYAKKIDPSFQYADVSGIVQASQSAVKANVKTLGKAGVSGMLHNAADSLQDYSVRKAIASPASAAAASQPISVVMPAVYLPDSRVGRFQHTQQNSYSCTPLNCLIVHCDPPSWCSAVGLGWGALTAVIGGIVQQCSDNGGSYAFCAALGAEIAALGLTVGSVATWTILAVGLLLLIICT